ncbi:DUF1707 and DUF4870 domain-containing protein [Luteococcus peritonei]|uniref:DUF1707 and DUF4870 domain-containing protein n=1 Tax=Luteococcus peritonei TaxID=88874 RepID=A0ABW4RRI8_9ACTN
MSSIVHAPVSRLRPFEHPSLQLPVTETDRDRSLAYLRRAYGEGRLTEYELDQRLETVLTARTRRELNAAFSGLAVVPVGTGASLLAPRRRPVGSPTLTGRAGGSLAHLSGLATLAVGPGVAYAMAGRGSYARHEAAKAFNFQMATILLAMAAGLLMSGPLEAVVFSVGAVAWFVLSLLGAVHAGSGENWRNPVTRALPLRFLDEGPRPTRRELTRS